VTCRTLSARPNDGLAPDPDIQPLPEERPPPFEHQGWDRRFGLR
jgi:hypothetical protein